MGQGIPRNELVGQMSATVAWMFLLAALRRLCLARTADMRTTPIASVTPVPDCGRNHGV